MHRHTNSLKSLICKIDVSAFAAVMFALVAMFVIPATTVYDLPSHVSVDFAKASHPVAMQGELREDAVEVAVTRDGQIYFGRDRIPLDALPAAIRERLSRGAERRVYIRADARARYGTVAGVLDEVRSAGIENVAFLVDQRER
jgi:biopolymer transport protein TolR